MFNRLAKPIPPPDPQTLDYNLLKEGQFAWNDSDPLPHGLYIRTDYGMLFLGSGMTFSIGCFRPLKRGEHVELIADGGV